jgi:hypothetical protein
MVYQIVEAGAEGNNQYLILVLRTTSNLSGKKIRLTRGGVTQGVNVIFPPIMISGWLPVLSETLVTITTPATNSISYNILGQMINNLIPGTSNIYRAIAVAMPPSFMAEMSAGNNGSSYNLVGQMINNDLALQEYVTNVSVHVQDIYRPIFSSAKKHVLPFNLESSIQKFITKNILKN